MYTQQKFGVCSWTFGKLALDDIARRLVTLGFDGVALMGDLARYSAAEVAQILGDFGLSIFSLTPSNVDLAHPETAVYQQAIDYYLRLLDFAAELGTPTVSCRGFVGRVAPLTTLAKERELLITAVSHIAERAQQQNLKIAFEVLNRYETHLIHTGAEALKLIQDINMPNVGILLNAYHMNLEEKSSAAAIRAVGDKLWLYHLADSNRQGLGRGHIKFGDQLWALEDIGYNAPIIFECTAPGANPFAPIKDENSLMWLETYLRESRSMF